MLTSIVEFSRMVEREQHSILSYSLLFSALCIGDMLGVDKFSDITMDDALLRRLVCSSLWNILSR